MMEGHQPGPGQHNAFTWFIQSQLQSVIKSGIVPEWFHGVISRKTSEELLMPKPPGYFLIRVSQTRIGYTLSYRAADNCRHFMIDVLGDGQYVIVGENRYHHCLQDLVDFHRRNPITPYTEVLTIACGQSSNDKADYAELLFPKRHHNPNISLQQNSSLQASQSHPGSQEHLPPALPHRPNTLLNSALPPPGTQTHRLYPNLEAEFPNVTSHFPAKTPQAKTPPEVPARRFGPTANEAPFGGNVLPTKPHEVKQSVISNLKNLKKKFQKNRSSSPENAHSEISVETTNNVYQEISRLHKDQDEDEDEAHSHINADVTDRVLPPEYQAPPPFAPGY